MAWRGLIRCIATSLIATVLGFGSAHSQGLIQPTIEATEYEAVPQQRLEDANYEDIEADLLARIEELEAKLRNKPNSASYAAELAECYSLAGRKAEARKLLEGLLLRRGRYRRDAYYYRLLVNLQLDLGDPEKALRTLRRGQNLAQDTDMLDGLDLIVRAHAGEVVTLEEVLTSNLQSYQIAQVMARKALDDDDIITALLVLEGNYYIIGYQAIDTLSMLDAAAQYQGLITRAALDMPWPYTTHPVGSPKYLYQVALEAAVANCLTKLNTYPSRLELIADIQLQVLFALRDADIERKSTVGAVLAAAEKAHAKGIYKALTMSRFRTIESAYYHTWHSEHTELMVRAERWFSETPSRRRIDTKALLQR